jgi:hypothetical protein
VDPREPSVERQGSARAGVAPETQMTNALGRAVAPVGQEATKNSTSMEQLDYYADRKFCAHCQTYVSYLMSVDKSFCVQCGNEVRLFSQEDWQAFNRALEDRRPKGGRPRKNQPSQQNKESA